MEIALQGQSKGIYYEGYDKTFIQCIFEEGEVQGRNERYEFRLMIIFIILALLLLLAILGTLAWLCAKRPKKEKFVPSPLTEEVLPKPKPVKVIQHSADEISRVKGSDSHDPPPLTPQRAQLAFYRPFVPDPMEETTIAQPDRATASFHDATEISRGQQATYSTLERPKAKNAQVMYTRPGFDNVPSY